MKLKQVFLLIAGFALAASLQAQTLSEEFQLDQENDAGNGSGSVTSAGQWQNWTVGQDGYLRGIELELVRGFGAIVGDFQVSIFSLDDLGIAVATEVRSNSLLPEVETNAGAVWLGIEFQAPVYMTVGSEWRMEVRSLGGQLSWLGGSAFDAYPDGTSNVGGDYDWHFRTYTSAIPEPSTYAMIFGGLALAFAAVRRRKKLKS